MKNAFLNITCLSVLSLTTIAGWSQTPLCSAPVSIINTTQQFDVKETPRFSYVLGLETAKDLTTYHLALKTLFPDYQIPSCEDLLNTIRSHPEFLGQLTQSEALSHFHERKGAFFIFENKEKDPGDFYIAYSKGLRHFTVNNKTIPGIYNGYERCYPVLHYLLESTFTV